MSKEYEKWQGTIWKTGTSLVITVPDTIAKYAGYVEGDELKILSVKVKQ